MTSCLHLHYITMTSCHITYIYTYCSNFFLSVHSAELQPLLIMNFLCVCMFLYFCTEIFAITQLATHDQHDMCIITTCEVNGTALYYHAYYEFCYASLNIMFCFGDQKNLNNISWEYPHMYIYTVLQFTQS